MGPLQSDERLEELETLKAIFTDEIAINTSALTARIHISVALDSPITLVSSSLTSSTRSPDAEYSEASHLPSLQLVFTLPPMYPHERPPSIELSTDNSWLPSATSSALHDMLHDMWEEYGHAQVLFSYISQVQEDARLAFGILSGGLEVSVRLEADLVEYDAMRRREIFEAKNFDCGICLSSKRGTVCYQMDCCQQVYCRDCLQGFYKTAIQEWNVYMVKCLSDTCMNAKEEPDDAGMCLLKPRELFEIGLGTVIIQKYVDVLRKKALRADSSTVWCMRKGCRGAAKNNKYPRIDVSLLKQKQSLSRSVKSSDEVFQRYISRTTRSDTDKKKERLAVCEDCNYAFCTICSSSWHGDAVICDVIGGPGPKAPTIDDIKSIRYIHETGVYCPHCGAAYVKTIGCNSMFCPNCHTNFCYRCGERTCHDQGTCKRPDIKEIEWKGDTYVWQGAKFVARSKKKR